MAKELGDTLNVIEAGDRFRANTPIMGYDWTTFNSLNERVASGISSWAERLSCAVPGLGPSLDDYLNSLECGVTGDDVGVNINPEVPDGVKRRLLIDLGVVGEVGRIVRLTEPFSMIDKVDELTENTLGRAFSTVSFGLAAQDYLHYRTMTSEHRLNSVLPQEKVSFIGRCALWGLNVTEDGTLQKLLQLQANSRIEAIKISKTNNCSMDLMWLLAGIANPLREGRMPGVLEESPADQPRTRLTLVTDLDCS